MSEQVTLWQVSLGTAFPAIAPHTGTLGAAGFVYREDNDYSQVECWVNRCAIGSALHRTEADATAFAIREGDRRMKALAAEQARIKTELARLRRNREAA